MRIRVDSSAQQIAAIADTATIDATLVPALISQLNQYPHATRVAIVALASAFGTVSQN